MLPKLLAGETIMSTRTGRRIAHRKRAIAITTGLCGALAFAPPAFAQAQSCSTNLDGTTYTASGRVTQFTPDDNTPFGTTGELILLDDRSGCRIAVAIPMTNSSDMPDCSVGRQVTATGSMAKASGDAVQEDDYLLEPDVPGGGWSCH
jgi:hypothetical protein